MSQSHTPSWMKCRRTDFSSMYPTTLSSSVLELCLNFDKNLLLKKGKTIWTVCPAVRAAWLSQGGFKKSYWQIQCWPVLWFFYNRWLEGGAKKIKSKNCCGLYGNCRYLITRRFLLWRYREPHHTGVLGY